VFDKLHEFIDHCRYHKNQSLLFGSLSWQYYLFGSASEFGIYSAAVAVGKVAPTLCESTDALFLRAGIAKFLFRDTNFLFELVVSISGQAKLELVFSFEFSVAFCCVSFPIYR
jgi:hypothetical protein